MKKKNILVSAVSLFIALLLVRNVPGQLTRENINHLQKELDARGATFTVGENPATKYPLSELCGLKVPSKSNRNISAGSLQSIKPRDLPTSFDWRSVAGCPPVRDQQNCGACWAFGTVAALECNILIKNAQTVDLSEQWLVSCNSDGWGCNGGWWAHKYHKDPGAVYESDFPYTASEPPCGGPYLHPYRITDWGYVFTENDIAPTNLIKQAVLDYGPIPSAIYAGSAFHAYTGGVFNISESGPENVNHTVTIVGWNDELGGGCWIGRNSWGAGWGDGGYIYITYQTSKVGYAANYVIFESGMDYSGHLLDDDNTGPSKGNDNGRLEPGETVEMDVILRNNTDHEITGISALITTSDIYVTSTTASAINYGSIGSKSEGGGQAPFIFAALEPIPQGHRIKFDLDISTSEESWKSGFYVPVHSDPVLTYTPSSFSETVMVGETLDKTLNLGNEGIWQLDYRVGVMETFDSVAGGDGSTTPAAERGYGGPDQQGYMWIDSNQPDGPSFDWVDISATGTSAMLDDDGHVAVGLPFQFPFYGQNKLTIRISSNGYLTFGTEADSYSNHPIPYSVQPNDLICPLWCDLNPEGGVQGKVYYYHDTTNERFIIQWDAVEHYPSGNPETFQAILHPNGDMYLQYKVVSLGDECTVGVENSDGSVGLEIVRNASYLRDHLAIHITPGSKGIAATPSSGSLVPGASKDINVRFDGNQLEEGIKTARILISSNDPKGTISLPVMLDIKDIGPRIIHTPLSDTQDETGPYLVEALITADAGLQPSGPHMYWNTDGGGVFNEVALTNISGDTYRGEIPGQPAGTDVYYYLTARDLENNTKNHPPGAPLDLHHFKITKFPKIKIAGTFPIQTTLPPETTRTLASAFEIQNIGNDTLHYTTKILYGIGEGKSGGVGSAGEVIRSWEAPAYVVWPWGLGCDGTNVWLGGTGDEFQPPYTCHNYEFSPEGVATGRNFSCNTWRDAWCADMAWDGDKLWQVNVGGDNALYQLDPQTGNVTATLSDPDNIWDQFDQRGLSYSPVDDTFFVGGWPSGKVYHIQGLSGTQPGKISSSFDFSDVAGLAWSTDETLWIVTNSTPDMIYQVNPQTGSILTQFPHPAGDSNLGGGLAFNDEGYLWVASQGRQTVYLVDTGTELQSWLTVHPNEKDVVKSGSQGISLHFDATGLKQGIYNASIKIESNDPDHPVSYVPVTLTVKKGQTNSRWTLMIYMDGDNNLEPEAIGDFLEISGVSLSPDINVLVQMDRIPGESTSYGDWTKCHRFVLSPGMTPLEANAVSDWGDGQGGREVNMGDPATLADFVNWGVNSYPATHYEVSLWNHGSGWRGTPKPNMKEICYDETDNDILYTREVRTAFENVPAVPGIIGMDACLMGMIEVAYELRNEGLILIGSEGDVPNDGWPYGPLFEDLSTSPTLTPRELAERIVMRFGEKYNSSVNISATDLTLMKGVAEAVSTLASAIMTKNNQWACVALAREGASFYDDPEIGEFRDLRDFAHRVTGCATDDTIRVAAENVRDLLDQANIALTSPAHLPSFGLSTYFVNPVIRKSIDVDYSCSNIQYACDTSWDEFLKAFLTVDVTGPVIQHTPLSDTKETSGPYQLEAVILDDSGVDTALLFWRKNGGKINRIQMTENLGIHEADIPGPSQPGDHYCYRIEANDTGGNASYYPGPGDAGYRCFDIADPLQGLWNIYDGFSTTFDLSRKRITFIPDRLAPSRYQVCVDEITSWTVNPGEGETIKLGDDSFYPVTPSRAPLILYGNAYPTAYVGSNGYITFLEGDTEYEMTAANHFLLPRVSPCFTDFNPLDGATVKYRELQDRVAITYMNLREYEDPGLNNFQVELFFNGIIRISYLDMSVAACITGLSNGQGRPGGIQTDFASLSSCPVPPVPSIALSPPLPWYTGMVLIDHTISDSQSNPANIYVEYSTNGGSSWKEATDGVLGDGILELATSPGGTDHVYSWNAMKDLGPGEFQNLKLRFTPYNAFVSGLPVESGTFHIFTPRSVDVRDYILGLSGPPQGDITKLDVNRDGVVDVSDILMLTSSNL